jgi:hypothetical protein
MPKDVTSRAAFKTFVDDSRALYKKYNKEVPEIRQRPQTPARRPEDVPMLDDEKKEP